MRMNKPWNDECLVGVYSEDLSGIASAIELAEDLLDYRIVDAEVAVLIREVNFYASQIVCYAQEIVDDEDDESEDSKDDEVVFVEDGTHSKYDLWGACHCIFQALELSQDRIVPPEIVALLEEARDCLDRVLFYDCKAKYAKVGVKFPMSKAKWISKINVCLF